MQEAREIWYEDQTGGKEPKKGTAPGNIQILESVSDPERNTGSSATT